MRPLLPAALLLLTACGTTTDPTDTKDAGNQVIEHTYIDVSGKVAYHPAELEWRNAAPGPGAPPSLEGVTINIEEALESLLGRAPLATGTVAADGSYAIPHVDITNLNLALVASVKDDAGLLAFSGYGLARKADVTGNLTDKPVFVISKAYLAVLAAAIGRTAATLETDGFILGRIVNPADLALEGAQLASDFAPPVAITEEIAYPNADYTGLNAGGTSSNGVFVFTPHGSAIPKEYTAVKGALAFEKRLAAVRASAALSIFIKQAAQ